MIQVLNVYVFNCLETHINFVLFVLFLLNTVQVLVFYMSFYTHVWLLENNVNTVALFSFST